MLYLVSYCSVMMMRTYEMSVDDTGSFTAGTKDYQYLLSTITTSTYTSTTHSMYNTYS